MNSNLQLVGLIATEVAPDESELAPAFLDAYLAGGQRRRDLFQPAGHELGAAGASTFLMAVIPAVLEGLAFTSGVAMLVLKGKDLSDDVLGIIKSGLSIYEIKSKAFTFFKSGKERGGAATSSDGKAKAWEALSHVIETLSAQLQKCGLNPDQCDAATLRVIRVLLENPVAAETLLKDLGKSADKT
ncbi:MAG: hypothetical protein JNK37_08340 [Verrucomicrobiales bacterium]|nr:hypothetical protein [Verrucomicrobiales bacterium]